MPQTPPSDDAIVTLQARAILDLDERVAELRGQVEVIAAQPHILGQRIGELTEQVRHRDETIRLLRTRVAEQDVLLRIYRRSRAVRVVSFLKDVQTAWRKRAARSRRR